MRVLLPSKNLGCLGFRLSERFYFDFFKLYSFPYFGMFLRVRARSWYITRAGIRRHY